jgi:SAM-dependent methyltransferase
VTPPDLYDVVFASKDYAREAEEIHRIVQERAPSASSLLDVACGTGRHLECLQRWYEVEGLDRDPAMLDRARPRLPDARLHVADMRDFDLGRRFDAVTCLFSATAEVGTREGLQSAIACMADHLRTGGVLLVEPWISPDDHPSSGAPWIAVTDQVGVKVVVMETSTLSGSVWVEDAHYLVWTPRGIEHRQESAATGAFTVEDHEVAFRKAGLAVERDPVGLTGRGLYIGVRR